MKAILKINMLFFLAALLLNGCKKDESKVYLQSSTTPVLTANQTALVLTKANAAQTAVTFSWTNPNYIFNTGVSSQNVTYLMQVDTTGSDFSAPQEVSIAQDLSKTFTVSDMNAVLTKLNLMEDMPHNMEFRIKASLVNSSAAVYSNVLQMVITPYLDVAVPIPTTGQLYITGDATGSGWTNQPPGDQLTQKISNTEYAITMSFVPGKQYKFLSVSGQWQPQYGIVSSGSSSTSGTIGYNPGNTSDPDAFATPSDAGTYRVDLNFKTGKYTVTKQ